MTDQQNKLAQTAQQRQFWQLIRDVHWTDPGNGISEWNL